MGKVRSKGVSAPGAAWLDFPAHTLDKTADTFLDVLVFHSDALPLFGSAEKEGWILRIN